MSVASWPEWIGPLLVGLSTSVRLTGAILLVGLPLGLLLAIACGSGPRSLRWAAVAFVEVGRGVPVLVLVYLVYFGLPQVDLTFSAFASASAALGVSLAAYTSEVFRAGIAAVPVGQREAARALGLTGGKELRLVVLPQAVRVVVPPLMGWAVVYFQATSLCFAIAVPELLSRSYTIGSSSFQYLNVLLLAALLFAAICIPTSQLIDHLERRSSSNQAPRAARLRWRNRT